MVLIRLARIFIVFFIFATFLAYVKSDILSLNNKYFNRHSQKISGLGLKSGLLALDPRDIQYKLRSSFKPFTNHDVHKRSTTSNSTAEAKNSEKQSATPVSGKSGSDLKIEVTKFDFINTENTDHVHLNWVGNSSTQRIFILMIKFDFSHGWIDVEQSLLWSSENYGETFQLRNFSKDSRISFMYTVPSNPRKILFTDMDKKMIYTTDDELIHNSSYPVPVEPDLIVPHPSDENKLLLYSYMEQKLFASENFAATWTLVAEGVLPDFYWGDPDFDHSADVVHMQVEGETPSQAIYKACLLPGCQHVSGDLDQVGPFVSGTLRIHKEYMFVQKENQNGSQTYLMVSYQRQPFRRAQFPTNEETSDFLILNLDDGQVFVAVHHKDTVNLYLSDVTGEYYVQSLENVFHEEKLDWFQIDFAEVKGLKWTFMANKLDNSDRSAPGFVQTYVSYDKGGNWAPLFVNKSCSKVKDCALLLELKDSFELDPMRSADTAPGIILAHGLLGQSRRDRAMTVFATRDGGATWKEAPFNNTCYLRILNHGSILAAIPDDSSSKIVHYSLDQGNNWQSQEFEENGLNIDWIGSEPGTSSLIQSIFGQKARGTPWRYVKLNMSTLLTRNCEDDDYEFWSPKDYNMDDSSSDCVLGKIVQYKRQKSDAICYNDKTLAAHIVNDTVCECTREDYECDFGYEKAGDACKRAAWFSDDFVPAECVDGGEYWKSQGYRKIPADVCIENDADKSKYAKKKADCPSAAPSGLSVSCGMKTIPLGKEVVFYLEQARGSKWNTNYTWDFGDKSKAVVVAGFKNASQQKYTFHTSGDLNIIVTAKNEKGEEKTVFPVNVQDRLSRLKVSAPWASVVGFDVNIFALPMSRAQLFPTELDNVHYLWSFGDEAFKSRPLLSWNSSMVHSYDKAGTFIIDIVASNSISSVSEQIPIRIFDTALTLEIRFEDTIGLYAVQNPMILSLFTQSLRLQIAQDLGINRDRLEAEMIRNQSAAYLFLFPTERKYETSVLEIKDKIIDQTKKGLLGFDLFGSHLNSKNLIKIISAKEVSVSPQDKKKSGPNLTPLYIAVPVLAIVIICSSVAMLIYFRRKRRAAGTRYTMFHAQDESDTMLDDEDVAPLNLDFTGGQGSRDDPLLDTGVSCLVMETGQGMSEDAAIC
ncbi:vps10 domain-containing receptor sorcs2 [Plakobranchus ocellatus]|uniref:Vps10 domain-containing receptor sorcs2 n=1 Tax=Plakobranchus ocellatus TaxID=259542 RepID=A0AAV4DU48_9GAST|nr:vps10 domain-containing receptor sorcs2 [Plakobranchus ocellatus]